MSLRQNLPSEAKILKGVGKLEGSLILKKNGARRYPAWHPRELADLLGLSGRSQLRQIQRWAKKQVTAGPLAQVPPPDPEKGAGPWYLRGHSKVENELFGFLSSVRAVSLPSDVHVYGESIRPFLLAYGDDPDPSLQEGLRTLSEDYFVASKKKRGGWAALVILPGPVFRPGIDLHPSKVFGKDFPRGRKIRFRDRRPMSARNRLSAKPRRRVR